MKPFKATITALSPFGTPAKGDTLFGQLCWVLRYRLGEERLIELLEGYTVGRPFLVVSDALPAGHLPRPALPSHWFNRLPDADRKEVKKRLWIPIEYFQEPVADWLRYGQRITSTIVPHPHNNIDRRTGTTGKGFDPYTMERIWHGRGETFDIYLVLDESRLSATDLEHALRDMGELGLGRDASIGLGRFGVDTFGPACLPSQTDANAWLTLAPCAPQKLPWQAERSFYTVFTRFGRHGDIGVHLGNPFKAPILLADTAAVLTPAQFNHTPFIGQGLGGNGILSKAIPATVHQGYAPVVGICLPSAR